MKKIPSVFKRDYEGTRLVKPECVPEAVWVLAGEGTPFVKRDGTAMFVKDGVLYKRYDVKKGRVAPAGAIPCEEAPDENTGHWPHWVPVGDGPDDAWAREAWADGMGVDHDGTYELVGPKVQGNPYKLDSHVLMKHTEEMIAFQIFEPLKPLDFVMKAYDQIKGWLGDHPLIEGIVWHHPDGRMAKVKRKDFGFPWPPK